MKVLDFGIAKTTEAEAARERRLTSPGMAMGTPEYMSPEQAAGRPADARCDVYALGAILYEMVTGVPPYSGDNFMEILTKKATQDPPPPSQVRGELPSQVSDLVMAAMARSPNDRPQTMEALEYELNKCLAGRGVAVAQILGMTTDAHVVATLNPGLSMRQFDDAAVVPRAQTSSPAVGVRAGTHSGMIELPSMWSGPSMSTGQSALMARQGTDPANGLQLARPGTEPVAAGYGSAVSQLRAQSAPVAFTPIAEPSSPGAQPALTHPPRSAIRVFGWLVLAAVLFGGVGALLFLALGERNAATKVADAAPGAAGSSKDVVRVMLPPPEADGSARGGSADPAPALAPDTLTGSNAAGNDARDAPQGDAARKPPPPSAAADDKLHKRPVLRTSPSRRPPPAQVSAATDDKDPKTTAVLVKQATSLEKAGRWSEARSAYKQLERAKGYNLGEALFHQAWNAFQSNATTDAVQLAADAARQPGPYKTKAMLLYGDALFRQGEFARAKTIYLGVRKILTGEERANTVKKIARCNKELKLPESDGVTD